jgi:hypothetical protein
VLAAVFARLEREPPASLLLARLSAAMTMEACARRVRRSLRRRWTC